MGVYDKKPLSCNGHSDKNISLFQLRNPYWSFYSFYILVHFTKLQDCKQPSKIKKMSHFLENIRFFQND